MCPVSACCSVGGPCGEPPLASASAQGLQSPVRVQQHVPQGTQAVRQMLRGLVHSVSRLLAPLDLRLDVLRLLADAVHDVGDVLENLRELVVHRRKALSERQPGKSGPPSRWLLELARRVVGFDSKIPLRFGIAPSMVQADLPACKPPLS